MAAAAVVGEVPRSGPLADAQVEVLTPRGNGASEVPSWFHAEAFLQPDFNADAFIADLRRHVPLETLSSELDAHLSTLKHRLVEVINDDYADFVSLSTQLVNVDGAVARMHRPLDELKERLAAVANAVAAELGVLQGGLRRRSEVAAARSTLELMQDTAHVMSKVEKLLDEVEAASPPGGDAAAGDLDARVRLNERVASEVSRLQFYAARGAGLPFIAMLQPRMQTATASLQARLAEGLTSALAAGDASAANHALQAYCTVGDAAGAQSVVRTAVAAPLVAEALEGAGVSGPRSGAGALPKALTAIQTAVQQRLSGLLHAVAAPASGLATLDFLGGSLLPEVDEAVSHRLPGAFSPGVPATFLANYAAAVGFLDALERDYLHSRRQLESFRAAPAVSGFLRRWNLSVYFSLRFQEIAGSLDTVVSAGELTPAEQQPAAESPSVQLQASAALADALQRCVAPDVFLAPLADRFVRLALQLVARYASWLAAGLAARTSPDEAPPPEQDGWGAAASAEQLALVASDADTVAAWLCDGFAMDLTAAFAALPQQARRAIEGAWKKAGSGVSQQAAPAADAITSQLAERCSAGLKAVRAIQTTYRMVSRPMPTRHSHYVPGVLTPLRDFLAHACAASLSSGVRLAVAMGSVVAVCRRFQVLANDLLESVRKTESSLKKLKKNRTAGGGGGATEGAASGASDADKMTTQLFLDVQEFGRQVFRFDVDPSELSAYRELWATVAPQGQTQVDSALLLG